MYLSSLRLFTDSIISHVYPYLVYRICIWPSRAFSCISEVIPMYLCVVTTELCCKNCCARTMLKSLFLYISIVKIFGYFILVLASTLKFLYGTIANKASYSRFLIRLIRLHFICFRYRFNFKINSWLSLAISFLQEE